MTKCDDCKKNTRKPRRWGQYGRMVCPKCWRKRIKDFIEMMRRA